MAKVISTLFVSADGVAEIDPEWHFPYYDENMGRCVDEDYSAADVLLLGRVTYDSFAGAWPEREEAGGEDGPFAKRLGELRKIIATRQPSPDLAWRNCEATDDVAATVTALRADPNGPDVLVAGSISVLQQLLGAGLIDELRLLVHPVAARTGRRLFGEGDTPYFLSLAASEVFPTGVVRLIYAPVAPPASVGYADVTDKLPDRS